MVKIREAREGRYEGGGTYAESRRREWDICGGWGVRRRKYYEAGLFRLVNNFRP